MLPLRTRLALLLLLGLALGLLWLMWTYHEAALAASRGAPALAAAPFSSAAAPPAPGAATGGRPDGVVPESGAEAAPGLPEPTPAAARAATVLTPQATALAEITVLAALAHDDPAFDLSRAVARLKPYTQSSEERVRAAALQALQPILAGLNVRARAQARAAAESALDLADEQDFPAALQALEQARASLPPESAWAAKGGAPKLQALRERVARRRDEEKAQALAEAEKEWRESRGASASTAGGTGMSRLLTHRDPLFRREAAALQARLEQELRTGQAKRHAEEAAWRAAWLEFLPRLSNAITEGDLDMAARLCNPAVQTALLKGGVAEPAKVLEELGADVAAIRRLYEAALAVARNQKFNVSLPMRRGHVEGTLDGAEGRQLFVALGGGARVGVKVENIAAAGLLSIQKEKDWAALNLLPAVWALSAYENPAEAATFLPKSYASAKQPLPLHWVERFRLEKLQRLDQELANKLRLLDDAVRAGEAEKVKAALEAARPALAALEEYGPLSEARQASVTRAEKLLNKAVGAKLMLQSGVSPSADYSSLVTDQLSQYRESINKTDVGVQYGLKVGAAGGLQRVLIRFDGLEAALGKKRVRRALLELYQIESPQANGAAVGLFRLKRAWVPDAGTWLSYDSTKAANWGLPGASSDADAESKEEAKAVLDNHKNVWRSWDVTAYVQDVLSGKAQNCGLLLRVLNGEPDYHVRFYPETDLDSPKDAKLRPRLVLEADE